MNRNILIAGGLAVGLLVGAVGTKFWLERARPTPGFAQQGAKLPSGPMKIMSSGGDLLKTCKTFDTKYHPDRAILITIPGAFDIDNLNPVITEWGVDAAWTGPDPTKPLAPPLPATWTPRTKLDLNLGLADNVTGNKVDKILIKIVIDDPKVRFRSDGYAIEAGNMNVNGSKMFCQFPGGFQDHSATFLANYYSDSNGSKPTFGAFNIGLVSGDGQPYEMPIFIDPDVMNNG